IDEFGSKSSAVDQKMASALRLTRRKAGKRFFIAVWQNSQPANPVLLDAYRKYADLVLVECYAAGVTHRFRARVEAARAIGRHGLAHKTVVVLGISDEYVSTRAALEAQVDWV